jgi:hypothetical protein
MESEKKKLKILSVMKVITAGKKWASYFKFKGLRNWMPGINRIFTIRLLLLRIAVV